MSGNIDRDKQPKRKDELSIRSSAAEYLTYIASTGGNTESYEVLYQDEESTVRKFRTVQIEGDVKKERSWKSN